MKLDDVPKYLKNSPLYISFLENQEDDNEEIFIEDRFLKDNIELNNLSDLENLLHTLNFWLIEDEEIPYYEIFLFVKNNKKIYEFNEIIYKFFNMKVILGISNLYYSKNKDLLYNIVKTDDIYLYKYYKKLRFKYKPSLLNKSFISGNCAFKIFEYEFNKIFNKNDIYYVLNIYEISNDIHIYNNRIRDIFFREFKKCKNKTKIVPYIFDYLKNINIRYIDCYIIDLIILTENLELIDLIKDNVNFIYHLFKIEDNNYIIQIIDYSKLENYNKILEILLITEKYKIIEYYKNNFNNIFLEYEQLIKITQKENSNEIFEYIKLNNINLKYDDLIKTNFIFGIKLLYQYDYIFNDTDALTIIRFDNVKILEFMYLKSYRGNEDIFYEALLNNRYNCVKFLFENCCPFDTRIYTLLENINMTTDYIYKKINNKKIKFIKFNSTINNKKIIETKYIIEDIT
jgi:hypothetical protein